MNETKTPITKASKEGEREREVSCLQWRQRKLADDVISKFRGKKTILFILVIIVIKIFKLYKFSSPSFFL